MSENPTSQTLIMKLQLQGDDKAWERFSREYRPYIYTILKKYEISHEDREDILQEIQVRIWRALPNFIYKSERCRFRTWLSRVCRNTSLNFLDSKNQRNKKLHVEVEDFDRAESPETDLLEEEEWQYFIAKKAWENIQNLFSEKQREVYLKVSQGKHQKEVAEEMGMEMNTAYVYAKKVKDIYIREIRRLNAELDG